MMPTATDEDRITHQLAAANLAELRIHTTTDHRGRTLPANSTPATRLTRTPTDGDTAYISTRGGWRAGIITSYAHRTATVDYVTRTGITEARRWLNSVGLSHITSKQCAAEMYRAYIETGHPDPDAVFAYEIAKAHHAAARPAEAYKLFAVLHTATVKASQLYVPYL